MKILLVDDEPYVTTMVATKLTRHGHEIQIAVDGLDGFSLAQSFAPDLIVTDLQMPRLSGVELAMRLFELETLRSVPVILLTGRGHLVSDDELKKTNIVCRLDKPFSVRDLVGHIEANLKAAA